jgi:hypothetical protein
VSCPPPGHGALVKSGDPLRMALGRHEAEIPQ